MLSVIRKNLKWQLILTVTLIIKCLMISNVLRRFAQPLTCMAIVAMLGMNVTCTMVKVVLGRLINVFVTVVERITKIVTIMAKAVIKAIGEANDNLYCRY